MPSYTQSTEKINFLNPRRKVKPDLAVSEVAISN